MKNEIISLSLHKLKVFIYNISNQSFNVSESNYFKSNYDNNYNLSN